MDETSTHQQLDRMITGYWISQAIYAALEELNFCITVDFRCKYFACGNLGGFRLSSKFLTCIGPPRAPQLCYLLFNFIGCDQRPRWILSAHHLWQNSPPYP